MILGYDYETKTTFWMDFTIAERFGAHAIRDTFNRAFGEWKTNVEYVTELVMVLNHKIWQHWGKNRMFAELYDELWRKADAWCCENLDEDGQNYYFRVLD